MRSAGRGARRLGRSARTAVRAGALLAALAAACSSNPSAVYQTCSGDCVAGTACLQANTTVNGFTGTFCTALCDPAAPVCPADETGLAPVCVPDAADPSLGQCYAGCPSGTGCPFAESCGTLAGVNFCVP